jgi:hypothetical protein
MANKKIIITCDTESLVFPQGVEEARANIFGVQYANNRRTGIELIMDIADQIGAKVIFFYDVFTEYSIPGINGEVIDYVLSRNHLIELHAHIEHLPESWWNERGYHVPTWATNYYDKKTVELVYSDALRLFKKSVGSMPTSFRAGSWRFCTNILEYLRAQGVKYSFNYYPQTTIRDSFPHGIDAGPLELFRWSNGLYEIPTTVITVPNLISNRRKYIGFENHILNSDLLYQNYMKSYLSQSDNLGFMVLVLHSWSLSIRKNGVVNSGSIDHINSFRNFLNNPNKNDYLFSTSDIYSHILEANINMNVPIEFAGYSNSPLVRRAKDEFM